MKITGSALKLIAILTMTIDHFSAIVLNKILIDNGMNEAIALNQMNTWIVENPLYDIMIIMRLIGRTSFPIFCFLLVEGFYNTRNVWKYLSRLLIFAILSEIPFDLAFNHTIFEFGYQNVFFTLAIGLLVLVMIQKIEKLSIKYKYILELLIITVGFILAEILNTDYAGTGVITIAIIYLCNRHYNSNKLYSIIAACTALLFMNISELTSYISIIPIKMYNGKRGYNLKYIFYVFYPVHLLLFWLLII